MCSKNILQNNHDKLKQYAIYASISTAVFLSLIKLVASIYTGSLAVLSSLIDSLSDVLASLISFVAVKISMRPATCTYRYGFGKAEAISALLQAAFIAGSGCLILYDGICRFFHPVELEQTVMGIVIMVVSIIATILLLIFQRYVAVQTKSMAIIADSAHYSVDLITNTAVIFSLIMIKVFDALWFDSFAAICVSFYLLYNAYDLCKNAIFILFDKELSEDIRQEIGKIIMNTDGVFGYHDLRTRSTGDINIIEVHIEIDGNLQLFKAHEIADNVENNILQQFVTSQVIIHQDPFGIDEKRLDDKLTNCRTEV